MNFWHPKKQRSILLELNKLAHARRDESYGDLVLKPTAVPERYTQPQNFTASKRKDQSDTMLTS